MSKDDGDAYFKAVQDCAEFIKLHVPTNLSSPKTAVICGSGLGSLVETIDAEDRIEFPFSQLPHFPVTTVQGHAGKLVLGFLKDSPDPIVFMVGRLHFYEGHSMNSITFPIRLFKVLGVTKMIVTNAAGGLNTGYSVGDIVVICDHINLAGLSGMHPLRGSNDDRFGPRFPALSDAYDLSFRKAVHEVWRTMSPDDRARSFREGTYAFVGGPSYETRAECRLLRLLGADLVGMSTVPEIIVARHCGIRILAMSLVTNNCVLDPGPRGDQLPEGDLANVMEDGKANHEEVLEAGRQAAKDMQELIARVLCRSPFLEEGT